MSCHTPPWLVNNRLLNLILWTLPQPGRWAAGNFPILCHSQAVERNGDGEKQRQWRWLGLSTNLLWTWAVLLQSATRKGFQLLLHWAMWPLSSERPKWKRQGFASVQFHCHLRSGAHRNQVFSGSSSFHTAQHLPEGNKYGRTNSFSSWETLHPLYFPLQSEQCIT